MMTSDVTVNHLHIEVVAERTGLTKRTIRYYEEVGLVAPSGRSKGGFRLYTEEDIARLERIHHLKECAGLSLAEIRELLEVESIRGGLRDRLQRIEDPEERRRLVAEAIQIVSRQSDLIRRKRRTLEKLQSDYEERLSHLHQLRDELTVGAAPSGGP